VIFSWRLQFHGFEEDSMMKRIALSLFAIATAAGVAAWAQTSTRTDLNAPQSAKEVRGASPYIEIKNEPEPRLIVDPPLPDLLDQGVVWIQWRAENVHIVPVFGKALSMQFGGDAYYESATAQQEVDLNRRSTVIPPDKMGNVAAFQRGSTPVGSLTSW
jgi:Family of unknown function (DUF6130)